MTFAVTYRNKSAVRETIYIEASDRADCFRILREKKINAISVSVRDKVPSGKSKNISNFRISLCGDCNSVNFLI